MVHANKRHTEVLVLGAGPGGYTAAFRAADLGKQVTLVERFPTLGGVCLNVGCIPSKALLHVAKVIEETSGMESHGVSFGQPQLDINKMRQWKESVIKKLTGGLSMLARQRRVQLVQGAGEFIGPHELRVNDPVSKVSQIITFDYAIIAAGSQPIRLPFFPEDDRLMSSTGALQLQDIPKNLLVLGGGIIGLEMAMVYHALGSHVTVVELGERILLGADEDIVKPLYTRLKNRYSFLLNTKVTGITAKADGLWVNFEGNNAPKQAQRYDRVLSAVGRIPNGKHLSAEKAGIIVDKQGFIPVNDQLRTNVDHIFAIGDIVGQPMLAHKASAEARVAAEVIAGKKHYFRPKVIPSVAYVDPEIAWTGLTEIDAKKENIPYELGVFPWAASGRSLTQGREEGRTKILFDPKTHRVLGAGIVGPNAGELISELSLAIEMGCEAGDIAQTIHPHPTLSESVMLATEMFEGTITDLMPPKSKR